MIKVFSLTVLTLLLSATVGWADVAPCSKDNRPERPYSPYVDANYPKNVYFGDTHVHTSYSFDAGVVLDLGPEAAYRFAKGEEILSPFSGQRAKLNRPLDFLMVADHAEYLGVIPMVRAEDSSVMGLTLAQKWSKRFQKKTFKDSYAVFMEMLTSIEAGDELFQDATIEKSAWGKVIDAAEKHNQPGKFTSFIGYEWTSMPGGNNLHRVVLFMDGEEKTKQILPFSLFDSEDPEKLWDYLADYEEKTGGRVLAIPHNGNVSNGLMFADVDFTGTPLTTAYAKSRARWEPLIEVTQIKGGGEAHPLLSPDDEFADFGTWDAANLKGSAAKEDWMLKHEYARSALKSGLALEEQLGANPYKFGMIGSTDTHTGLTTAREENFFGKHPGAEPMPCRAEAPIVKSPIDPKLTTKSIDTIASGYAAVWATENTREALFEAMKRREVYATTGPRMVVRFFGGWDYTDADALGAEFNMVGYDKGVPMGGDLPAAPQGKSPSFLISALKDPDGANLDRIQVVKGWVGKDGKSREKIYNVALSDDRQEVKGMVPPVGNTVNIETASYSNSIGDTRLVTRWQDPEFNPAVGAFYYVRVIEIPTPRWPAYDAKYFEKKMAEGTEMFSQERAYTSPIWYTPSI
jgi:hypothetical protein